MMRVKLNDTVAITVGKDRNKRGKVIEILPKKDKVLVKGLGLITKHMKARKQGETSGIKSIESYLKLANVMPVCPSCDKVVRVNVKTLEDGKHVRICNKCKEIF